MEQQEELEAELEALESYFCGGNTEIEIDKSKLPQVFVTLRIDAQGLPSPMSLVAESKTLSFDHLPPITFTLSIPADYPESPPRFDIKCMWLSLKQLSMLCRNLDEIAAENAGCPLLLQWALWLQDESVAVLGIQEPLKLDPLDGLQDPDSLDFRAAQDCASSRDAVECMRQHAEQRSRRGFLAALHNCGVCLEQVPGVKAQRLAACQHVFCKECLRGLCGVQIKEGAVQLVKCPDLECGEPLLPTDIRPLVEPEEFERYERMSLARVLDQMTDLAWCPRCHAAVIKDEDDSDVNLGRCGGCDYCFCLMCRGAWHHSEPCASTDDKTLAMLQQAIEQIGTPKNRNEEEKLRKYKTVVASIMSERHLAESGAQKCPRCKFTIEKNGGCNKMTCLKCGVFFCWLCLKVIQDYSHFQFGDCKGKLFPENPAPPVFDMWDAAAGGEGQEEQEDAARSTDCPECGVVVVKESSLQSNAMSCDCGCDFCFNCQICFRTTLDDPRESFQEHYGDEIGSCKEYTTIPEETGFDFFRK
mmetsp:Transcript_37690/g.88745  ORF Transcript_37690/g.88745 Transcript_37690/m.88745 type:complete len:529 (-) Transcript_37690:310-1896(-)